MKLSYIRKNQVRNFTQQELEYITYVSQKYEWVTLNRKNGELFDICINKRIVHNLGNDHTYPLTVSDISDI